MWIEKNVRIFICICLVAGASSRNVLWHNTMKRPPTSWIWVYVSLCKSVWIHVWVQRKLPNAAAIFINSKSRRLALGQWKTGKWKRMRERPWGNEHAKKKEKTGKYDGEEQEKEDGGQKNYEKNETKVVRKGGEGVDRDKGAVEIQSFQQESTEFHVRAENFPTQILLRFQVLSSGFTALTSCLVWQNLADIHTIRNIVWEYNISQCRFCNGLGLHN